MKVILVESDGDYGAMTFEQEVDESEYRKYFDLAKDAGGKYEGDEWSVEAHEFGEVDPKFVDFITNHIQDYDDSKHTNFFVVEE